MLEIFLLGVLVGLVVALEVICSYTKLTGGRAQMAAVGEVTLITMIIKERFRLLSEALQRRGIPLLLLLLLATVTYKQAQSYQINLLKQIFKTIVIAYTC